MMITTIVPSLWNSYANYVKKILLPNNVDIEKDIDYWRNEIFCNILIFLAPVSITAIIPCLCLAFINKIPVVGFADLVAFCLVILVTVHPRMAIKWRKYIFIFMIYCLAVVIIYYVGKLGPGMLFLLTATIFSSILSSSYASHYSIGANLFICVGCWLCIYFRVNIPLTIGYDLGSYTSNATNLFLLSVACAECLNLLLRGLHTSIDSAKILAANLASIIESTDAFVYSLDGDFRYITTNQVLKNIVKESYNIEIKPGDNVFDVLEKSSPEEALFWKNIYIEALSGNVVKFEKDFSFDGRNSTTAFTFNAIVKNGMVIGISCFAVDITERINAQREIKKLNDELEIKVVERTAQLAAANKELETFSYSVSHDLRVPLRAVNGYAQMLREDYGTHLDQGAERIIENIIEYAKKMGQLIDDLLAFSRLTRKELVMVSVPVMELVENICREIENETQVHPVQFKINQLVSATGDRIAINQVWVNLISNAVKYSREKENPIIEIGCEIKGDEVIYYVKDNGAGFDMRYADKLFGVFQRLHSEEEFEGNGVGLATVHRIISKHGARIWAEAKVNEGASFYFTLK